MRHRIGNGTKRVVTHPQIVLVNECIVNAINVQVAENGIVNKLRAFIMKEAERLEKVLIDYVRTCGNNGVNHVVFKHVYDNLLETRADKRTRERQNDGTLPVLLHHIQNGSSARKVPRLKSGLPHLLDKRDDVKLFDVNMSDRLVEQSLFGNCRFHCKTVPGY